MHPKYNGDASSWLTPTDATSMSMDNASAISSGGNRGNNNPNADARLSANIGPNAN
jgi:hypothetical protein